MFRLHPFRAQQWVTQRFRVGSLAAEQSSLSNWFDTPYGAHVLHQQRLCCDSLLSGLGGYRAAQLGVSARHSLLSNCHQTHRFMLTAASGTESSQTAGVCDFAALPLPSNTIDLAILHHALDFSSDPHSVLSEAARVVVAGGYVVLLGFNPYSTFGLSKWPAALCSDNPVWRRHSLRQGRVLDWLRLLGFQPVTVLRGCRQLPVQNPALLQRLSRFARLGELANRVHLPGGAFYAVVARKQVVGLTGVGGLHWPRIPVPGFNLNLQIPDEQPTAHHRDEPCN